MTTRSVVSTGRVGRPPEAKMEKEENQKCLDFKGDTNNNKKGEKKQISFEKTGKESVRMEEVKNRDSESTKNETKDLREYILKEINDIKKEWKGLSELGEEWKKKERNWEIRIRILEEKAEEKDRETKDLREKLEDKDAEIRELRVKIEEIGKDGRTEKEKPIKSGRSRERSRMTSSRGSYIGSDINEDQLSTGEVGKVRK